MFMLAQWAAATNITRFDTAIGQIDSYNVTEHDKLPPPIPEKTVVALPANSADRTGSTADRPMWGFRNGVGFGSGLYLWNPYDNTGVPDVIRAMNTDKEAGYGFDNWKVPSRTELDALISRGAPTETAKQFLLSLDSRWPATIGTAFDVTPYIWMTQEAGNPSWANSFAIPCQNFNGASFVTVKTFTGYVHTAVGPVTNALSLFPAQYKNYNRPDPHIGQIQVALKAPNTVPDIIKACEAILKDTIAKVSTGYAPFAALLATRSTGSVNYLP
jgi:hypothetical protein